MSGFVQFSEAAHLYAQYWGVVEAMAKEYQRDVDAFLDALRDQVGALVAPAQVQERRVDSTRNRYWWLADEEREKDACPQLWLDARLPTIVGSRELRLTAIAPKASGEQLRRLAEVATRPALAPHCNKAAGGPWSVFTVVVRYPETNPVQPAAEPIARVLKALNEAYAAP